MTKEKFLSLGGKREDIVGFMEEKITDSSWLIYTKIKAGFRRRLTYAQNIYLIMKPLYYSYTMKLNIYWKEQEQIMSIN